MVKDGTNPTRNCPSGKDCPARKYKHKLGKVSAAWSGGLVIDKLEEGVGVGVA